MVGDNGPGYIYIYIRFAQNPINSCFIFVSRGPASCQPPFRFARSRSRRVARACTRNYDLASLSGGEGRGGGIGWIIHEGRLIRRGWIKIEKRTYFKYELSWLEERWGRVKRGISKLSGGENSICTRLIRRYFWNIGNNNNSKDERFFFHPIFPYDFSISDRRNYYLLSNDTFKWK